MDLPPAIAPWAEELGIFRDDVALAIGAMVARVAHAIGPLPAASLDARDEPDGFGGVARRGSYERLLLSEWLLANEIPEEFTRRAASGEHAFLELAHRSPATERRTLALFDAGPSQVGAPRLAQLAVLVALARRAADARATLRFRLLQGDAAARDHVDEGAVRALFAPASGLEPTAEGLARARAADELTGEPIARDTWVIGGPRASRLADESASRVEISDVIDGGAKRLEVVIRAPASQPRTVELELPPDPLVTRIFRDPFRSAKGADATTHLVDEGVASVVFSGRGTKVFARVRGMAFAVTVPQRTDRHVAIKRMQPRGLAAVGRLERDTYMLTADESTRALTLRVGKRKLEAGHYTTEHAVHAPWRPSGLLSVLAMRRAGAGWAAFYRDERRWLFGWSSAGGRSTLIERGVLTVASNGAELVTVSTEPSARLSVFPTQPTDTLPVPRIVFLGDDPILEAHVHLREGGTAVAALRVSPDRYRFADSMDGFIGGDVEVGEHLRPIGVTPAPHGRASLLAVAPGGRVLLAGPSWSRDVLQVSGGPAAAYAVDAQSVTLAALHADGVLELWSLRGAVKLGSWDLAREAE